MIFLLDNLTLNGAGRKFVLDWCKYVLGERMALWVIWWQNHVGFHGGIFRCEILQNK